MALAGGAIRITLFIIIVIIDIFVTQSTPWMMQRQSSPTHAPGWSLNVAGSHLPAGGQQQGLAQPDFLDWPAPPLLHCSGRLERVVGAQSSELLLRVGRILRKKGRVGRVGCALGCALGAPLTCTHSLSPLPPSTSTFTTTGGGVFSVLLHARLARHAGDVLLCQAAAVPGGPGLRVQGAAKPPPPGPGVCC
jgi:hypothetical protein